MHAWQGWLVFERTSDRARFATDVETTQPNAEAILYWGSGLSAAYFDGALARAQNPAHAPAPVTFAPPATLAQIERDVLAFFTRHRILSARSKISRNTRVISSAAPKKETAGCS